MNGNNKSKTIASVLTDNGESNQHAKPDVAQSPSINWNGPCAFNNVFKQPLFQPQPLSSALIYFTLIFNVIMFRLPPLSAVSPEENHDTARTSQRTATVDVHESVSEQSD